MKKYLAHILLIPLVALALTPPWVMRLQCTVNSLAWIWSVFASGFLAFLFLNFKVNVFLKLFLIWCFVSSFVSRAPYVSFTMFWTVIVCAYYYLACTKIGDFGPVKKVIQSVFFLIILLIIMQLLSLDTLLNFGLKTPTILGTIGNKMMLASFICVLAPFLIHRPLNWVAIGLVAFISESSGIMLSIGLGLGFLLFRKYKRLRVFIVIAAIAFPLLFAYKTGDFKVFNVAGRGPVWKETAKLIAKKPLGYGIATYKILFPVLCSDTIAAHQPGREWVRTHNSWLQMPFEVGILGFLAFLCWLTALTWKVRDPIKQAGLIIIGTNMAVHFPDRMCQSVFIIIMFLAYAKQRILPCES